MGSGHGGPRHGFPLPELQVKQPVREREWRSHFDPQERARRLHDYLTRRAFAEGREPPPPLQLRMLQTRAA